MIKQTYAIGLDIGTTSTKAVVYTLGGEVCGIGNAAYPILVPQAGWAEQDPETIYTAAMDALREAVERAGIRPHEVAAVGLSAAMHSIIAVDAEGKPLTNSIIWADNRSVTQTASLKSEAGLQIYHRTGTPIHPMSPLTKLIWMKESRPDMYSRAAKFISIKEYVLHKLFGVYVVDHSIASTTGLFDIRKLDWDEGALQAAGITRDRVSEPVPVTHILSGLSNEIASMVGLLPETPFVVGASDGVLANLGAGAVDPGQIAVTIGTSGAIRTVVDRPLTDPSGRTFCYLLTENKWVIGGPTNNGGLALRWFRDQFGAIEVEHAARTGEDPYDLLLRKASQVEAGAEGLLFLPYLTGERAPHWNADARGSFFGLALHHQREHLIRAVLEGILFGVYHVSRVVEELAGEAREIRASGGFARSALWRQMMTDMFGVPVALPHYHESSSLGAALLAFYGVGAIESLDVCSQLIRVVDKTEPDPVNQIRYSQLFQIYERLYENTKLEMGALADYQRK